MKDLEKIKSEDLAAQVQDANPGNFAIEQEVAALVGATVPAPTEPSADDARELGAQLLVFLRRALLPIRSALRTAVAAIYAHLDSRCTDYTPAAYDPFRLPAGPYDPMRPLTPRTLPNLLTAITAFAPRKISNGSAPNDGIPDGTSLAHLLCSTDAANAVLKIGDDNPYTITRGFPLSMFPNVEEFSFSPAANLTATSSRYGGGALINGYNKETLTVRGLNKQTGGGTFAIFDGTYRKLVCGIKEVNGGALMLQNSGSQNTYLEEIDAYGLEKANCIVSWCNSGYGVNVYPNLVTIKAPALKVVTNVTGIDVYKQILIGAACPLVTKLEFPALEELEGVLMGGSCCPNLEELRMPNLKRVSGSFVHSTYKTSKTALQLLEVGAMETDLNLDWWNPTDKGTTFLQNFKDHIALRLTANGSGKTLTLSKEVRNAIHAAEATYGIEAIIVTQKGWTLSPAPGASSQ